MPIGLDAAAAQIPLESQFSTPDAMAPMSAAYGVADQKIGVEDKQREVNDMKEMQKYLKMEGGDLSTQEGVDAAVQKLKGRVSPQTYMKLDAESKGFKDWTTKHATDLAKRSETELGLHTTKTDTIIQTLGPVYQAYDEAWKKSLTDRGIDPANASGPDVEQAKKDALPAFNAAKQARLGALAQSMPQVDGKPVIEPQLLDQFGKMEPEDVRLSMQNNKFYNGLLKVAIGLKKEQAETDKAAAGAEKDRAQTDILKKGGPKAALYAEMVAQYGEDSPQAKAALAAMGGSKVGDPQVDESTIPLEERKLAVNQWINNPSSMRGMNKTYQQRVIKWANDLRITPEDVNSGRAKMKFDLSAAGSAGRRAGSMAVVEETMPGLIKNALEASAKVPRHDFVPWNQLVQMKEGMLSNPALRQLRLANQALASEFQQVISRGGANVTALTEAMHQLNVAESPTAYKAALTQLQKEIDVNVEGAARTREKMGGQAAEKLDGTDKREKDALRALEDEYRDMPARIAKATGNDLAVLQNDKAALEKELNGKRKAMGLPPLDKESRLPAQRSAPANDRPAKVLTQDRSGKPIFWVGKSAQYPSGYSYTQQ